MAKYKYELWFKHFSVISNNDNEPKLFNTYNSIKQMCDVLDLSSSQISNRLTIGNQLSDVWNIKDGTIGYQILKYN